MYIRICITHQNGVQQYRTDWIFIPPRMESIQYSTRHPFCRYIRVYFTIGRRDYNVQDSDGNHWCICAQIRPEHDFCKIPQSHSHYVNVQ